LQVYADGKELFLPCLERDPGAMPMTWREVPNSRVKAPEVMREDVFAVLENAKASVSPKELWKYEEWTAEFGAEGA
jgi:vacuolar protein-sorting-associated protein 4